MARFYEIQIGSIYLTSDGTSGGRKAQAEVPNWEDLLTTVTGSIRPNADGSPDLQLYEWTAGKQFEIRILTMLFSAQWEDLKDLLLDSLENGNSFTVVGTGDTGNFSVTARANPDKPFAARGFENGRILEPVFRLITV